MSDQLRDQLWDALSKEPKPLSRERVLSVARQVLAPSGANPRTGALHYDEFAAWYAKHGERLLEKLNV